MRNIEIDEEITISYNWTVGEKGNFKTSCLCHTLNCRKIIQLPHPPSDVIGTSRDVILAGQSSEELPPQLELDVEKIIPTNSTLDGCSTSFQETTALRENVDANNMQRKNSAELLEESNKKLSDVIVQQNIVNEASSNPPKDIIDLGCTSNSTTTVNDENGVYKLVSDLPNDSTRNVNAESEVGNLVDNFAVVNSKSMSNESHDAADDLHLNSAVPRTDIQAEEVLFTSCAISSNNNSSTRVSSNPLESGSLRDEALTLPESYSNTAVSNSLNNNGLSQVISMTEHIIKVLRESSNEYNTKTIEGDFNKIIVKLDVVNRFPLIEFEDTTLSEDGGIWNAPEKKKEDSICYFSSAVQLMFRSFCHLKGKKLSLYQVFIEIGDFDIIKRLIGFVKPLLTGKTMSYETKSSLFLARKTTMDCGALSDKSDVKNKEEQKFLDPVYTVHWIISYIYWPECGIKKTTYNESKGEELDCIIECFNLPTPEKFSKTKTYSLPTLLINMMNFEKKFGDGNDVRKIDYTTSSKFVVCFTGKEPIRLSNTLYISWENEYKHSPQYGMIRGFICFHDKHFFTYMRSYLGLQNRWICYNDEYVTLDAKEATLMTSGARVIIYDSCDFTAYNKFINSHDGVVHRHILMKEHIGIISTFISSILSYNKTKASVTRDIINRYIIDLIEPTFVDRRGPFLFDAVRYHIHPHINVSPSKDVITEILSFYVSKSMGKQIDDGTAFVMNLESELCLKVLGDQMLFEVKNLQKLICRTIGEKIWLAVKKQS